MKILLSPWLFFAMLLVLAGSAKNDIPANLYNPQLTCEPNHLTWLKAQSKANPQMQPNDWMAMQRMYPYGELQTDHYLAARRQAVKMHAQSSQKLEWELAGPTNIGGRITDIEVVPDDLNTMYIGAATGGIYKTTTGGAEWENVFENYPTISIGDLAIDPENPEVIWAGTGEANASSYSFLGSGVYKSENGGQTWTYKGLDQSAYIGRVVVDHSNSQRVFVAACGNLFSANDQRGVYRTADGGNSWERVLYLNDSTSAIDLVQHPENPQILYAAMWERIRRLTWRQSFGNSSGIWKTVDGGNTWYELTSGLPTGSNVGRIGIDISRSNPNVLYAFYDNQDFIGVYKTNNGGENWSATNFSSLQGMNSNFGWYFGQIRINPANENEFFLMGVDMNKSENGGESYENIAGYWNFDEIHVDHHAMWIDPVTETIFEGNDGGLYISYDHGFEWTKINNLPITQFYSIEVDYGDVDKIYGGTQDNNTIRTHSGSVDDWIPILGGDGMVTVVDYSDPFMVYAEYQNGNIHVSYNQGNSFNWIAVPASNDRTNWSSPYVLDTEEPSTIYFGTYRVWKGLFHGQDWSIISPDLTKGGAGGFHTLTTIAVTPLNNNYILTGSDDGLVHITTNGGQTWTNVTNNLPDRWITAVRFDPFDINTLYATCSGFRWDEPLPHVYRSDNLGQSWYSISGNLPELPVNAFECDPEFDGRYFVGTDAGLFSTDDGGNTWYGISAGMPATPVVTLKIHEPTLTLFAGTYGNSIYKISLDAVVNHVNDQKNIQNIQGISVFPNPVDDITNVRFRVSDNSKVSISLINIKGENLGALHEGQYGPGTQSVQCNLSTVSGKSVTPGIYFIRVNDGKHSESVKILVK